MPSLDMALEDVSTVDASAFAPYHSGTGRRARTIYYEGKDFIGWDGEGYTRHIADDCGCGLPGGNSDGLCTHHYCLFGSSTGTTVSGESLSTKECLDLILQTGMDFPGSLHIGFAFQYDVNMILRDLRPKDIKCLKEHTFVHWRGYRIEHIPKKWFTVSREISGKKVSVRIQDIFSFFGCSFVKALTQWKVGNAEKVDFVSSGKADRGRFELDRLETDIRPYWEEEIQLLVSLGNKLRDILYSAGLRIDQWFGPGNIATFLYKKHKTQKIMDRGLKSEILEASQYAYAGGRFEAFKAGLHEGTVFSADINSAYPAAIADMPNLQTGTWHYTKDFSELTTTDCRMGLFRVRFRFQQAFVDAAHKRGFPFPVFHRRPTGQVWYPGISECWYHAPEFRLLVDFYNATNGKAFRQFDVLEGWIFQDDGTFPFAWVRDMYAQRAKWKSEGNAAQMALKLGINSLYGKMAQRIGSKNNEAPTWHQLEWAGHITATARSMLYNAMKEDWEHVISVETDGIYSTRPFTNLPGGSGSALGQWECETYSGMLFLQNGVYWLRDSEGKWLPPKSRGIPTKQLDFHAALSALQERRDLVAQQKSFLGYGTAYHRDPVNMSGWRTWVTNEKSFEFGGNGKRWHNPEWCSACLAGRDYTQGLHTLSLRKQMPMLEEIKSAKHYLPWAADAGYEDIEELKERERWEVRDE